MRAKRVVFGGVLVLDPAIDGLGPARGLENAGGERADIAGEPPPQPRW